MTARRQEIEAATGLTAINPKVATDCHPDSLLPFGAVLVDSDQTDVAAASYDSSRRALKALYESSDAINRAVDECKVSQRVGTEKSTGRPIVTFGIDPQRAPQLAAAMGESFQRAASQVEATEGILGKTAEKLEADVAMALRNRRENEVSVSTAASEIRGYVSRLKDSPARMNFLQQQIEAGDHETLSAILQTTPWQSGLTRDEQARIRDLAALKFACRPYKQLGAVRAVKAHLDRVQRSYAANYFAKLPRAAANAADDAIIKLKG